MFSQKPSVARTGLTQIPSCIRPFHLKSAFGQTLPVCSSNKISPMFPWSKEGFCTPVLQSPAVEANAKTSLEESSSSLKATVPPRVTLLMTIREQPGLHYRHTRHSQNVEIVFPSLPFVEPTHCVDATWRVGWKQAQHVLWVER